MARNYSYYIYNSKIDPTKEILSQVEEVGPFDSSDKAEYAAVEHAKQYAKSLEPEGYLRHNLTVYHPDLERSKDPKHLYLAVQESRKYKLVIKLTDIQSQIVDFAISIVRDYPQFTYKFLAEFIKDTIVINNKLFIINQIGLSENDYRKAIHNLALDTDHHDDKYQQMRLSLLLSGDSKYTLCMRRYNKHAVELTNDPYYNIPMTLPIGKSCSEYYNASLSKSYSNLILLSCAVSATYTKLYPRRIYDIITQVNITLDKMEIMNAKLKDGHTGYDELNYDIDYGDSHEINSSCPEMDLIFNEKLYENNKDKVGYEGITLTLTHTLNIEVEGF